MKFFSDLSRACFCLLGALLIMELAMRASGERFQASFYAADYERGYALRPLAEGWNVSERENYVRINSRGLRDREHDLKRAGGTIRIAVIGDSESEAVQVPLERTYFSVMERALNDSQRHGSAKVEIINFGVGGYGLAPQYLTLQRQIWQYDPQIVLVVNPVDGLILRSSRRLYPGNAFGAPFFDIRNSKLELDAESLEQMALVAGRTAHRPWTADLMNQSRFLSLVNSSRVKATNNAHQLMARFHAHAAGVSPYPADYWKTFGFLGPANADLKDAWDISEALILAMHDEAARHGAEFWLCMLDIPPQVDPDPHRRIDLQTRLGLDTLWRSNQLLREFLAQSGIQYMDLAPELANFAAERNVILHGFKGMPRNTGHLNEAGHEAVGRTMAAMLQRHSVRIAERPLETSR
jgi:hypothetical protein